MRFLPQPQFEAHPTLEAVRGVVEVVAAAETESELVGRDLIFRTLAFLASFRLHYLVSRHRLSTVTTRPVCLLAEDS